MARSFRAERSRRRSRSASDEAISYLEVEKIMRKLFEGIGDLIEDLVDLFDSYLRRSEPTVPMEEVIAQLKSDGNLIDQ